MGGAGFGVADLEGRAGQRRRELGVVALALIRQHLDERADRAALPAHEEVEPVLGHELDREVPVGPPRPRGCRACEPMPCAAYQRAARSCRRGSSSPSSRARARAQQLREQQVVAEPLAARVHAQHKPVGALQLREDVTARTLSGQRVGQVAADAVDDRGAQEEAAQPRRLAIEHLGQQVVADDAVVARELLDEALGVVAALQAVRGQPQPGAPALGAGAQRRDQLGREVDAVGGEQRRGLGLGEGEVGGADLDEAPADAQDVQRDRRVGAGAEHEPQRVRGVQDEEAEVAQAFARARDVHVVEDEDHAAPAARPARSRTAA